ncbi:hypothetical protein [Streptomyces scopuliridis]|uniref:hypothetical protein n=1 Tax=Streptomyces scopuliridis TaxID=452529 RepID=UPI00343D99FC
MLTIPLLVQSEDFCLRAGLMVRLSCRVGAGFHAPVVMVLVAGMGCCWSARVGQSFEPVEGDLDDLQPDLALGRVVQGGLRRPVERAARMRSSARTRGADISS